MNISITYQTNFTQLIADLFMRMPQFSGRTLHMLIYRDYIVGVY